MFRWATRLIPGVVLCKLVCSGDAPGVWLNVPFVRQHTDGCGSASIAMVMQYWQLQQGRPISADAEQIQRLLYSPRARGILASAMEQYFRQHGFRAFVIQGEKVDLEQNLQKGRPLIVALKTSRTDLHYVVVTGFDWRRQIVLTNDPAARKLVKRRSADFQREWKATGNWTLLALPE